MKKTGWMVAVVLVAVALSLASTFCTNDGAVQQEVGRIVLSECVNNYTIVALPGGSRHKVRGIWGQPGDWVLVTFLRRGSVRLDVPARTED